MAVLCSASLAADVKMDISANRTSLYLGESVVLTIKVSGMDSPPPPDVSAITNATVKLIGSRSANYSSIIVVNGQVKRDSFTGRIFAYDTKPLSAGRFVAGPIRLVVDGRNIEQAGPVVEVTGVEKQPWAILSIASSRDSVLVDEPFEITLTLALKRLKAPYADHDPLDPGDPPALNAPFLDSTPIDGLTMPNVDALVDRYRVGGRSAGVTINDRPAPQDMFDPETFFGRRRAKYIPERRAADRDGQAYFEYAMKFTYIPEQEGSYTFGPAEFKGKIVIDSDTEAPLVGKMIFAVGAARTVQVVPPPEDGRPVSYIGALGTNLQVDASLDTQTCNVGDPLKLTLSLSGGVRLENIYPPRLRLQPELGRNFRINEDSFDTVTQDNRKQYIYTVRPTRAGTYEFPPVEVSFYDTKDRCYRTLKSRPLPIRANETFSVQGSNIIYMATNRTDREAQAMEGDSLVVGPLNVDPAGAVPSPLGPRPWHAVLIVLGPALYAAVRISQHVRRNIPRMADAERRRHAARRATRLLREARQRAAVDVPGAHRLICEALKEYLGQRFGVPSSGLTPADARALLTERTESQALAAEFGDILERSFNAAFSQAAGDTAAAQDSEAAVQILEKIEQACRAEEKEWSS